MTKSPQHVVAEGGRQGLCDCEGHLIVRSFHGQGEGLHYYTTTLCWPHAGGPGQGPIIMSYNYDKVLL